MRWEHFFADLEGQLDRARADELAAEVADRTRAEAASIRLVDRLRGAVGHPVRVSLRGGLSVSGELRRVGPDWLLMAETGDREVVVVGSALLAVTGLGLRSSTPGGEGSVAGRLGLGHALRAVARDRAPVVLLLVDGARLTGTLDRVGADFVELAEHPGGEARRSGTVAGLRALPFDALAAVLSS